MMSLNLTDGDINQRKEIVQVLNLAIAQRWPFSYVTKIKKRIASHALQLVSVNAEEGTFCIVSASENSPMSTSGSIMFRAQSGGISIVFQSRMTETSGDAPSTESSSRHHFELPYKVACTQLRKTVRVNLESLTEVPVILYMVNGAQIEGTVMDISTSGAKFRVEEDLGQKLKNLQIVDTCKISLPNDQAFQTGVQLIDMINDEESKIAFLRSQFAHMRSQDEDMLESFISEMLQQIESADPSIPD